MTHAEPELKTLSRQKVEHDILETAKRLFAQHGYGGVSIDRIAAEVGISKQVLLYYFPKKTVLYRAVLNGVLDVWLSYMDVLGHHEDDPRTALSEYIAGKLRFSIYEETADARGCLARRALTSLDGALTSREAPAGRAGEPRDRR